MAVLFHCTPRENLESILEKGLIPQIGIRSQKIGESAGVFLFPTYNDCEEALMNWLGDEFEEIDAEPIILKIVVPDDFPLEETVGYERVSRAQINPKFISIHVIPEW